MTRKQFMKRLGLGIGAIAGMPAFLQAKAFGESAGRGNRQGPPEGMPPGRGHGPGGRGGPPWRPERMLLRGGHVLTMSPHLGDLPDVDVLISEGQIERIGKDLDADARTEVLDARGMIVMPGLINNHQHLWQGVIRGVSADHTFTEYFQQVLFGISPRYSVRDAYLGNLLGAYEALDCGITTVLDWSHITNTQEHAHACIEALRDAGIRALYGYASPASDGAAGAPPTPDEIRSVHAALRDEELIGLAMATQNPETSDMGRIADDIGLARELEIPVTLHAGFAAGGASGAPTLLHHAGLLGDDITFVHGNGFTEHEFRLIAEHGAHVSSSPEVEMQMGLDASPLRAMLDNGVAPTVSADIVSAVSCDLFTQLRFILQTQRMLDHREAQANGLSLESLSIKARDVLPYATTHAAASLLMEDRIGSLEPGKQADVILVRTQDPNMFPGDPAALLVQSSHPGNVDTVIVGGRVMKRHGELLNVDLDALRDRAIRARQELLG